MGWLGVDSAGSTRCTTQSTHLGVEASVALVERETADEDRPVIAAVGTPTRAFIGATAAAQLSVTAQLSVAA